MKTLYIIPARGGSKGIPKKNIKLLNGKPLIYYSIDIAREMSIDENICVSTDSDEILYAVEEYGLKTHFKRPAELAEDNSGTYGVLMHAVTFFENKGIHYDNIVLLQPTSPFRMKAHIEEALSLYNEHVDMVVSVGKSHHSPYFNLFEEEESGFLKKSKKSTFETRQAAPPVYFYNGSIYIINIKSLKNQSLNQFEKIRKYEMSDIYSFDIDTPLDWAICETLISNGYIKNE